MDVNTKQTPAAQRQIHIYTNDTSRGGEKKKLKLVLPGLRPWTQVPDISAGQEETENHVPYVRHAVAPN